MAVRREYVADLYRNVLGREGSDGEIEGHLNNPGGEQGLLDLFSTVAGNNTDGRVNEATVGSAPQVAYQSYYDVQGTPPPPTSDGQIIREPAPTPPPPVTPPPAAARPPVYDPGKLHGFAYDNFVDPAMKSVKYTFARIASRYPPTPSGLAALVNDPEFKSAFPNAKKVGKDGIDFGGALSDGTSGSPVGYIDVGEYFDDTNDTGRGWWWGWDTGGGTGTGTGTSGTSGTGRTGGSGTGGSGSGFADLAPLLQALGQKYAGPGDAGITTGPLQQVGQDPLSQVISGGLVDFLSRGGTTPYGQDVAGVLMDTINRAGQMSDADMKKRFESSRELIDKARRTMINDARGDLAERNLLSEPGIPQGAEIGAMRRITENLAPEFARATRDIVSDEADRADARLSQALGLATGMAADQAKTFLAGIGEGTARQSALAQIALQSLEQNQAWSMFLAEFGLKRDSTLAMLQAGQVDDVLQLLNSFISLTSLSRGGYI